MTTSAFGSEDGSDDDSGGGGTRGAANNHDDDLWKDWVNRDNVGGGD